MSTNTGRAITEGAEVVIGVRRLGSSKLSASQPDYTAFCQLLKSSKAQEYFLILSTDTVQRVADQCWQQGEQIPQVLYGAQTPHSWLTDPAFQGSVATDVTAPFFDTAVPEVAAYRAAMKTYIPSLLGSADDSSGGSFGWAMGQLLAYAVKHGGGITAGDIINGLYTAKDQTLGGLIVPLTFTRGKNARIDCGFLWTIENQGYALTQQKAKPACAPTSLVASYDGQIAKSLGAS